MTTKATGTFDIEMVAAPPELGGAVSRFDFSKTFHGDLDGAGTGLMLSGGDPASGAAGYVAIEVVQGVLDGRTGQFAMVQLGLMQAGAPTLHYEIVPGSGDKELAGITGALHLVIDPDGTHHYDLTYDL